MLWSNISSFNNGMVVIVLDDWGERRNVWDIMDDVRGRMKGRRAFVRPVAPKGIGVGRKTHPVVLGGPTYETLVNDGTRCSRN